MKILITGTSGFIGSRLLEAICRKYGQSNVVALSSSQKKQCSTVVYEPGEFRISQSNAELIQSTEVLLHAGAFIPKNSRDANSVASCNGNIIFTDMLLKLPFNNLRRIIYLSTTDVYAHSELISEITPIQPETLYGLSKLYCEKMIESFAESFQLKCQILRVGHVYGPGEDAFQKFLPEAIRSSIKGNCIDLWGDGSELRSYLYIDDVVRAILVALHQSNVNDTINLVSGRALSIRQILDQLIEISRKDVKVVASVARGTRRDFVFDNSKMRNLLTSEETDFLIGLKAEYSHFASLQ
jgi:UDP-glucose 4-epimerase